MLWKLIIVICVLWLIIRRWQRRKMIPLFNQFAMKNWSLPLLGHAYLFVGSGEDRMKMLTKLGEASYDTGGLLTSWLGNKLYILVSDPSAAEAILKNCLEKDDILTVMKLFLGNGSIFAPVQIWRPRRKILAPIFTNKTLNQVVNTFDKQSGIMAQQLEGKIKTGTFSIWKYFTSYSMDSICETTLGINTKAQLQSDIPFLDAFSQICQLGTDRVFKPWLQNDTVYQLLPSFIKRNSLKNIAWDFINDIIKNKRRSMALTNNINEPATKQKDEPKTFLELLIKFPKSSGGYGDLELREELLVLILGGTDTSAVGASFTALMLSLQPDVQERCYKEVISTGPRVTGGTGTHNLLTSGTVFRLLEVFGESDRPVTAEDLPRLKYLDTVIRETLRMYPPVPFIVREIDNDYVLPSGVTLVKGCGILVSIFALHRNPEYWGEDADQFRPERFLDSSLKHPAAFMPFSCGPRNCIGNQYAMRSMKTALATLLRQYRILPATAHAAGGPKAPLRLSLEIMLRHVDNFELQLESRSKI